MTSDQPENSSSIKCVDHIAIAVWDISNARPLYELLGFEHIMTEEVEPQDVRVAKLDAGNTTIELLEPTVDDSTVGRFLSKNGPGLHHICLESDHLDETLDRLQQEGIEPLYNAHSQGAQDRAINFLHPKDTHGVLIELQQALQTESPPS